MGLVDEVVVRALAVPARRYVLGIAGGPGAGKSTLADALAAAVAARGCPVGRAPMDGFHLSNEQLERLARRDRKGAPDTFDVDGYAELLRRVRSEAAARILAPDFDRDADEPVADVHVIAPAPGLVVAEGNYLGLPADGWPAVRDAIDELWFLDVDPDVRAERCRLRQLRYGATPAHAQVWVRDVDRPNGELVDSSRNSADLVLTTADVDRMLAAG